MITKKLLILFTILSALALGACSSSSGGGGGGGGGGVACTWDASNWDNCDWT